MKRMAVVGAGAMGTLLGARLTHCGYPADLVDADREIVDTLNRNGAVVTGKIRLQTPVHALTPDELTGEYDLFVLLTKQTMNDSVFAELLPHLAPDGAAVTMQNGLPEPAVAEAFGEERTMGCAVTWASTLEKPGVVIAQSDQDMWNNNLGRLDGKITPKLQEVQEILQHVCRTGISTNLLGIRWGKLIINCSFSGMSAALGCSFGQVLDNPEALACAQHIARECIRVCRAQNVVLEPIGPEGCLDRLMDFSTEEERSSTDWIYRKLFSTCYDGKASMLQDLERGRRTEIRSINGVLCSSGRKSGVPTPFSDRVVELVEEAEEQSRVPGMENLSRFEPLLADSASER